MTATKMNAQEIIQFIANAEKKTSVKVTSSVYSNSPPTAIPRAMVEMVMG